MGLGPDDDTWQADTVPNLLLVERIDAEVSALLAKLGASLPEGDALRQALGPYIAGVPPRARATLESGASFASA